MRKYFSLKFHHAFYAQTIGESAACLLTAGDEHDYEKFYKIPLKSYWAGRVQTGHKSSLLTDAIKIPMHGVDIVSFITFNFYYYTARIIIIFMPISAKTLRWIRRKIRDKIILKDKLLTRTPKPLLHKPSYLKNSHIQILLNKSLYHEWLL